MKKIVLLFSVAALCCASMFAFNEPFPLPGKFTVNTEGTQVQFSPALLYCGGSFGIGNSLVSENEQYEHYNVRQLYYAWGTGDDPNYTGAKSSFVDWGVNVDTEGNPWRTMSADEWKYLLATREHAEYLCGFAKITNKAGGGVYQGLMLFPDDAYSYVNGEDLKFPEGLTFVTYKNKSGFTYTGCSEYTYDQWKQIEAYGAVFLQRTPLWRNGEMIGSAQEINENPDVYMDVRYWTSTSVVGNTNAKALFIPSIGSTTAVAAADCSLLRNWQLPVRLVKDVDPTEGIETPSLQWRSGEATKFMMDGTLYIATPDGKLYNTTGAEVK